MFTEHSLGCWSSAYRNLSMYQVSSSTVFFFVSYMHIHAHVLVEVVCCCFKLFTYFPMFVGSQSFISLPSFMFVCAVVSEIRKLKEKKEKNNF